jgi:ribosome-associated protein
MQKVMHEPIKLKLTKQTSQVFLGQEIRQLIIESLEDSKAEDIVSIDLAGKSDMADYMIVATGQVNRHVGSIATNLIKKLKDEGYGNFAAEGMTQCDWVLIDVDDVIVHVFRPEIRELYNLEKMWMI